MKKFCLLVTFALAFAGSAAAQSDQGTVVKTANGFLVVSNEPGNYYTVELKGKTVTQDPDCPVCLMVDNKPVEVVAVSKRHFLKDPTEALDDMGLLIAYRNWETESLSNLYDSRLDPLTVWLKLADGSRAVVWSYDKPPRFDGDKDIVTRVALATVKGNHLLLMDISVGKNTDVKEPQQFLLDAMNSVRTSDKPISIEKVRYLTR